MPRKSKIIKANRATKYLSRKFSVCFDCGRGGPFRLFSLCRICTRTSIRKGFICGFSKGSW